MLKDLDIPNTDGRILEELWYISENMNIESQFELSVWEVNKVIKQTAKNDKVRHIVNQQINLADEDGIILRPDSESIFELIETVVHPVLSKFALWQSLTGSNRV